jgi:hypothetical protein
MGWSWLPSITAILIYFKTLWEHKYRMEYQRICDHFLAPLDKFIFCTPLPCMIDKSMEILRKIGDWYLMEQDTYIILYGVMKPPHFIPWFVINKLVLQEVVGKT